MTVTNLLITSGANDGFQDESDDTSHNGTTHVSDSTGELYLFQFAMDVPQGATINTAVLQVYIQGSTNDEPDHTIWADDADNSATITAGAGNADISTRTPTTATVDWASADLGSSGGFASTPDISTIIQEIVDRPGWSSGNRLSLIITLRTGAATGTRDLGIDMYDLNSNRAAKLDIDYTGGGGGGGGQAPRSMHQFRMRAA